MDQHIKKLLCRQIVLLNIKIAFKYMDQKILCKSFTEYVNPKSNYAILVTLIENSYRSDREGPTLGNKEGT